MNYLSKNEKSFVHYVNICIQLETQTATTYAIFFYKQAGLEIRQSTIYYAWSLGRWDKRIVHQASDVPSIIFFRLFIDLGHSKLFTFIFLFFLK